MSARMVGVGGVVGRWLHGRCRWRLPVLLTGILFAVGRRTVASWLRAAGVTDDWKAYYYFISASDASPNTLPTGCCVCC